MMQDYFFNIADQISNQLHGHELFTCYYKGEVTDFCRLNQGKIRQSGNVDQHFIDIRLIAGQRHLSERVSLSGNTAIDHQLIGQSLGRMRQLLSHLPDDPFLSISQSPKSTVETRPKFLADKQDVIDDIFSETSGLDLVGILASGAIYCGFANSFGQRNWFESSSFNFDWSLYDRKDKAVKLDYAGFNWDSSLFREQMSRGKDQLELMKGTAKSIKPGAYRVYLAPAALESIWELVSWGGFGLKSNITKHSPLLKLQSGEEHLDSRISLTENVAKGVSPNFDEDGYLKPSEIKLISSGQMSSYLISARSAKEYQKPTTAASADESPESLWMQGGGLAEAEVLSRLGTGLYINNLWYLNFSDRSAGKVTGMTRFASFWVENGQIVAPLNVMRFDDSIYRLLGEELEDLTSETKFMMNPASYGCRSSVCSNFPGLLIKQMNLTL